LLADGAADGPGAPLLRNNLVFFGAVAAAVVIVLLLVRLLFRRTPEVVDPEAGMMEDLTAYPPPPALTGRQRLTVQGQPVRVRFVVVAPVARQGIEVEGGFETLLDLVVRGLGAAARQDQARVRTWPLGLSRQGFTPMFFRRTRRPEPACTPSRWILLAGPARSGVQQVLLGLALWADEPNPLGNVALQANEWNEWLRWEAV
jgi:hypothetical protein